ncbi:MAG TPA: S9 family peptidase [Candidatus Saccharimonadales bacterium]|nr:S9 family peptidase [Candidatus Saccharimonadales bacterium]
MKNAHARWREKLLRLAARRSLSGFLVLVLVSPALAAQEPLDGNNFFRRAFLLREFQPKHFGPMRWMDGGEAYTTVEASPSLPGSNDLVRYETATGKREILIPAKDLIAQGDSKPLVIEGYDWSSDASLALIYTNSRRVWRANTRGDYWLFDRGAKSLRKLGGSAAPSSLMFAKFSPDGTRLAYVSKNEIYVETAKTGQITRLTNDSSASIINGTTDWVYEEEFFLRDAFRWSPDGKQIAYWQFDTSKVRKFPLVYNAGAPYQVTTQIPYPEYGFYPVVEEIPYPEPGTPNSAVRIGVVSAGGGGTTWMRVPGDPSDNYIARMEWAGDSTTLVLQHLNRQQNTNDVLLADAKSGSVQQIYRDHDQAWVDVVNNFQWLHGGRDFLWVSEQDGWRHIYSISRDGKQSRLLTKGDFDVIAVEGVTPGEEWVYYSASPENATQRYLYRSKMDGTGLPERISPAREPGTHAYQIAPNFHWAVDTYSAFDSPPAASLVDLTRGKSVRSLASNSELQERMKDLISQPVEFTRVDIGQNVTLDAWIIKPKGFNSAKKYPVLVFVYGEPASQTVLDAWDGETSLFHRALAEMGYVIVSIDNRGTPAPKGRAWRKIVYGSVGVLSSQEQATAFQVLARNHPFFDTNRVAVWGWSGGGSNTLNLMFRSPEIYKVGMSVAPVADQRLYDTIYQERFMGTPQENPDGYKAGSPINFAEGLRGNLLIVHSPGDDNVHFQGTELLINRLVELGKPFDFMEYPGRTHSLAEGAGTHFHLYSLLARYLAEHVKPGPLPE